MTQHTTEEITCDVCGAEIDKHRQQRWLASVPQQVLSKNRVVLDGIIYDLCMVCAAPFSHLLKERLEREGKSMHSSVQGFEVGTPVATEQRMNDATMAPTSWEHL